MEWDEYRKLCDRPNVVSRWMLAQTIELLEGADRPALAAALAAALDPARARQLPKPAGHRGGRETDMFELALERTCVDEIAATVAACVAANVRTSGTLARGLGGFAEAWEEYRRWLERQ